MCFITGKHEPYKDALKCFENGHGLIKAYKEKYGYSYRRVIKTGLKMMDRAQKRKHSHEN